MNSKKEGHGGGEEAAARLVCGVKGINTGHHTVVSYHSPKKISHMLFEHGIIAGITYNTIIRNKNWCTGTYILTNFDSRIFMS